MLALAVAFMFNVALLAQNQGPKARKAERNEFRHSEKPALSAEKRAALLAIDLGLTDAEKSEVQALFVKQAKQREMHRAEVKKLTAERKSQFEAERNEQNAALEKIIGTEKFKKLETIRVERHEKIKAHKNSNYNDSTCTEKKAI